MFMMRSHILNSVNVIKNKKKTVIMITEHLNKKSNLQYFKGCFIGKKKFVVEVSLNSVIRSVS